MRMRKLGKSGLFVSELSFGAMTFGGTDGIWGQVGKLGQDEADALVKAALDAGINLFDTANIYANGRSEEILGQSFRNLGVDRDDVVAATKGNGAMGEGPNRRGNSRGHILSESRASLRRLGIDHIDLYQLHAFDPAVPMEDEGDRDYRAQAIGPDHLTASLLYSGGPRSGARDCADACLRAGRVDGLEPPRWRVFDRQVF